jgi:signal transduction histidine kinase
MAENKSQGNVLVIDDDPVVRQSIAVFLEESGYIVTQATDGREGLEAFRREHPDIILVDLRMPNVDGMEVIATVNAESPDTPLVVVSATGVLADAVEAVRKGAWDYVTKPIEDMAVLELTVQHALEKRVLIEENRLYQEDLEQLVAERTRQLCEELAARKEAEAKRAKAEKQFRQAQKMEAIGQLAAGIAHDFNNVLTAIQGNAELCRMRGSDNPECQKSNEETIKACQRAAELTRKLLSFARRGKQQTVSFDLHDTIQDVVHLLRHSIDRQVEIEVDPQASPSAISGDPGEIHSALLNLGLNARDAMPHIGNLTFTTRLVELQGAHESWQLAPGSYIEIAVTDTGTGMDAETQSHIFEPFFTTKGEGKGTGLGLAAVYGCVKSHDGDILVQSEVGQGSVFRLMLPAEIGAEKTTITQASGAPIKGTGRILLVDDEEIVRNFAATALRHLGYDVHMCADGVEALAYFEEHHNEIDLVFVDLIMPVMSALEILTEVRRICPAARVLVYSGYSDSDRIEELLSAGAIGFLSKPFGINELSQKVADCLGKW